MLLQSFRLRIRTGVVIGNGEGIQKNNRELAVRVTNLLNGHGLGQIPGLVYVPVSQQGDVIGKHL